MRKMIAYPLTAALLILGGCSKLDTPDKPEPSCDMCHTKNLNLDAVHRMHLSNVAMNNFPFKDNSPAANYAVLSKSGDTTLKYMVDTGFKFSNSASLDKAKRYQQNGLLNYGIKCVDCHNGVDSNYIRNSSSNHRNGVKDPSFDQAALKAKHFNAADTAHYLASGVGAMTFDGTGCNNIVCHGAGRKPLQNVTWNTSAKLTDTLSCMGCHNTKDHKPGVACDKCHYDVTLDGGKTIHNFRKHLNDTINYGKY